MISYNAEVIAMSSDYTLHGLENEHQRLKMQAEMLYGGPHFLDPFLKKGSRVIDVGCGTGNITNYVASNIEGGIVHGIDIDGEKIKRNMRAYDRSNIQFLVCDASRINSQNNSYDLAYTRFLLMHLKNPFDTLKEMIRVTKPGGYVVAHEGMHDALWLRPDCPHFNGIINKWKALMTERGQDHSIGLKLNEMFVEAGLEAIHVQIMVNSASKRSPLFKLYLDNLRQLVISLETKDNGINKGGVEEALREMNALGEEGFYLELTIVASGRIRG